MIVGNLRKSQRLVKVVEPTITHMGNVGGGSKHQGSRHRGAHPGFLGLIVLIHGLIGLLDACHEQGKQRLWQHLLRAEGA
ncbi:hypothetical protein KSC_043010 [Ktedonobacter sp. SOSP1-52]|nr:hypothetical protein KSC_043010 [Ktedonobacter sp. SOSP1-52]